MKSKLRQKAEEILQQRKKEEIQLKIQEQKTINAELKYILEEFEKGFSSYLLLLREENIKWEARTKSFNQYKPNSFYILFTKDDRTLKMDFINKTHYRYEYTEIGEPPSLIYEEQDKTDFILFIYNGLLYRDTLTNNSNIDYSDNNQKWHLKENALISSLSEYISIFDQNGHIIAKAVREINRDSLDELIANAKIIAKAPEMLSILKTIYKWITSENNIANNYNSLAKDIENITNYVQQ